MVGTIEYQGATGDRPIRKLVRSLDPDQHDEYIVQVFKCNRSGLPTTWDDPYYEQSYGNRAEALEAHREVVQLLSNRKLSPRRRQ